MALLERNTLGRTISIMFIVLITGIYTSLTFSIYLHRTLKGEVNHHILSAKMFGVPHVLQAHGVTPFYQTKTDAGWDGQFYYYMSNDLSGRLDTAEHIDTPSYRYQRIGLAVYVATIAKLCGLEWVSPRTYIVLYFCLIILATWVGARLFQDRSISPFWILIWSLSVGTQLTLFNALPDAAADAFLILAMAALWRDRVLISLLPFTLAILSREVYLVFLICILFSNLFNVSVTENTHKQSWLKILLKWHQFYLLLLPGLIVVAWHYYVRHHFHNAPVNVFDVKLIGYPFQSWWTYFVSGLKTHQFFESGLLVIFLMVLLLSLILSVEVLRRTYLSRLKDVNLAGSMLALIFLTCVYVCFGDTVMSYYTGYLKVQGIFLFFIPLAASALYTKPIHRFIIYGLLIMSVILTSNYHLKNRILPNMSSPFNELTHRDDVKTSQAYACLKRNDVKMKLSEIKFLKSGIGWKSIFKRSKWLVMTVEVKNMGSVPWVSSNQEGGVFMSYQWVNTKGAVILDGIRTAFTKPVLPGETAHVFVVSRLPRELNLSLKLSPVQEGCAWFYQANAGIKQPVIMRT